MKRLHVHVRVGDLEQSIAFYTHLFASEPSVRKPDYAKWRLDDPSVNFAISSGNAARGIEHLGIEVDDGAELAEVYARMEAAEGPLVEEGHTTCCYARSEKSWIGDPSGVAWEIFNSYGESEVYGEGVDLTEIRRPGAKACC